MAKFLNVVGIFSHHVIVNLHLTVPVEEVKSVFDAVPTKKNFVAYIFGPPCTYGMLHSQCLVAFLCTCFFLLFLLGRPIGHCPNLFFAFAKIINCLTFGSFFV